MFVSSFHPPACKLTLTPAVRRDYQIRDLNTNSSMIGPAQREKKSPDVCVTGVMFIYSNSFRHISNVCSVIIENKELATISISSFMLSLSASEGETCQSAA